MTAKPHVRLGADETRSVLELVNPHFNSVKFHPDTAIVMVRELAFYPGCRLLDLSEDETMHAARRYAVQNGSEITVINWTNEPIYHLNETVPVHLTEKTVIDYARFFFLYVKGRHGRFLITETVDDINWKEEPPPAARKAVGKMLVPLNVTGKDEKGSFLLDTCVMFRDSLFRARVTVTGNGFVNLGDEELLVEEMPVLDDTFAQ